MRISIDEARHVASLARLKLDARELERLSAELTEIVNYVEQLAALDPSAGDELSLTGAAPLRADLVAPCLDASTALAQAPATSPEGFSVPGFVEST